MNYHFATIKKLIDCGYRFVTESGGRSEWKRDNSTRTVVVNNGHVAYYHDGETQPVWSYDFKKFIDWRVFV